MPAAFGDAKHIQLNLFSGGHRRGETPVPIPNTEVKPSTGDGTSRAVCWESSKLPDYLLVAAVPRIGAGQAAGIFDAAVPVSHFVDGDRGKPPGFFPKKPSFSKGGFFYAHKIFQRTNFNLLN